METKHLSRVSPAGQRFRQAAVVLGMATFLLGDSNAETIIRTGFNRERVYYKDYPAKEKWVAADAVSSHPAVTAKLSWEKLGTIDVANTHTPTEALVLKIENPTGVKNWTAAICSGLLAVKNTEANLGKVTFSFDNLVSSSRPVVVRIESFDAGKKRTGGLEKTVHPATANHFLRSAFELSDMKPFGEGAFSPTDPFVSFRFAIGDLPGAEAADGKYELRIDNVSYSTPAYYVRPTGNDSNDGRTEASAFLNPQAALDKARPGDIILLMEGSYRGETNAGAVADFKHPGRSTAWITLKNYPGHKPTLLSHGKAGVRIAQGSDATATESPLLSYIEVRGLHIRGNADEAHTLFPAELGSSTQNTEVKGINIFGDNGPTRMYHHFRLADNIVEYCGGYGIFARTVDYLTVENNILRNNCWTTVDLCSAGFGLMMYADFDKADNVTKILVRNNQAYGNQCKAPRKGGPFNGDGFLFDANCEDYIAPDYYLGRTLIQNNLVYGNGGGGIQMWGSHRLDVVNNTIYHNGITPQLKWGNLGFDFCKDVRVINNIVVALPDRPLDSWWPKKPDRKTSAIVRVNNLYFGGLAPAKEGSGDLVADPQFVNPSLDPALADFRLKAGSPAINAANKQIPDFPMIDLAGRIRDSNAKGDRGAFTYP